MRKSKHILFLTGIILILSVGNLISGPQDIKLAPQGYVRDYAGVLPPSEEAVLTNIISELERKTTAEIAVVTIPTLGDWSLETFAVDLFEKWGIGKKDKDNGVLILIAMNEKKVRIEVGYGLEGVITDSIAGMIIRQKMAPYFRQNKFAEGLIQASATVADLVAKEYNVALSEIGNRDTRLDADTKRRRGGSFIGNLLFILFLIVIFGFRIFFIPLFLGGGGYWGGGGGGFGGFGGFGGGGSGGGGASGGW